jgi:hypothetical protein
MTTETWPLPAGCVAIVTLEDTEPPPARVLPVHPTDCACLRCRVLHGAGDWLLDQMDAFEKDDPS